MAQPLDNVEKIPTSTQPEREITRHPRTPAHAGEVPGAPQPGPVRAQPAPPQRCANGVRSPETSPARQRPRAYGPQSAHVLRASLGLPFPVARDRPSGFICPTDPARKPKCGVSARPIPSGRPLWPVFGPAMRAGSKLSKRDEPRVLCRRRFGRMQRSILHAGISKANQWPGPSARAVGPAISPVLRGLLLRQFGSAFCKWSFHHV